MKTYTTLDATGVQPGAITGKVAIEVLHEARPPKKKLDKNATIVVTFQKEVPSK